MKEIKCEVIRDLLPLYEDNAASEETAQLVREHLKDCPECREELRKMRTPISLPPDDDVEAVKRFLERRAQIRRKQNRKIICAATALAVLAALLLCYILPRDWASLAKLDEVDTISASITELYFIYPEEGEEEDVRADWRRWDLDTEGDTVPAQQLLSLLDNTVFLPKVSNLRNYTPFPREIYTVTGAGSHLNLYLFTQDYQNSFFATFYSNGLVCIHHSSHIFVYGTRENPYEALASIVRTYGTLEQEQTVIKPQ